MRHSNVSVCAIIVTIPSPGQSAPRACLGKTTVPRSAVNSTVRLCAQCLHNCCRYLLPLFVGTWTVLLVIFTAFQSFAQLRRSTQ